MRLSHFYFLRERGAPSHHRCATIESNRGLKVFCRALNRFRKPSFIRLLPATVFLVVMGFTAPAHAQATGPQGTDDNVHIEPRKPADAPPKPLNTDPTLKESDAYT